MTPEFSRTVRIDTLGASPRRLEIEADEGERQALARRFGLVEISRLAAEVEVSRNNDEVRARGQLQAEVAQSCVATTQRVDSSLEEPFDLLFRPRPEAVGPEEEIELSEGELDVIFHGGAAVDIGEAVAETLSLGLDPYPRAPGAEQALKAAGIKSEEEAGPFGALAALRDKLKK